MSQLVFFLEEPSAEAFLQGLLPKILPDGVETKYVVFQGKQDLDKRLPKRLRAWQTPGARFVVLRDQDSGDCAAIKQHLEQRCAETNKPNVLVRIACRELESFYLGDLAAVANAIGPTDLRKYQNKSKYRNPDSLFNPFQELKKIAPMYQKIAGSRAIAPHLSVENNRSTSFHHLIRGIRSLVAEQAPFLRNAY